MTDVPAIRADVVSKSFGSVRAVHEVSLEVQEGEFFSLLGPSGCGKTTMLRMLAGFEHPDHGRIYLRGEDVTYRPANKRAVNMVFQNYELFPHMSVFENVAYGLKLRKVKKPEIQERVARMLDIVGVGGLEKRGASQLSGGQQQRVALARALVNEPAVLLLDEPLSALDVKLRKRMQLELKSIQHELRTTFVYVTHDQEEALLMSDRVGIMSDGVLLQVAPPRQIYERPADPFVADFVGTLNELAMTVESVEGNRVSSRPSPDELLTAVAAPPPARGETLRVAVRPEQLRVEVAPAPAAADENRLLGVVTEAIYLGPITQYVIDAPAVGRIVSQRLSDATRSGLEVGQPVVVTWATEAAIVLGRDVEERAPEPSAAP